MWQDRSSQNLPTRAHSSMQVYSVVSLVSDNGLILTGHGTSTRALNTVDRALLRLTLPKACLVFASCGFRRILAQPLAPLAGYALVYARWPGSVPAHTPGTNSVGWMRPEVALGMVPSTVQYPYLHKWQRKPSAICCLRTLEPFRAQHPGASSLVVLQCPPLNSSPTRANESAEHVF